MTYLGPDFCCKMCVKIILMVYTQLKTEIRTNSNVFVQVLGSVIFDI